VPNFNNSPLTQEQLELLTEAVVKRAVGYGRKLVMLAKGSAFLDKHSDDINWINNLIILNAVRMFRPNMGHASVSGLLMEGQKRFLLDQVHRQVKSRKKRAKREHPFGDVLIEEGDAVRRLDPPPPDPQTEKVKARMKTARLTMLERAVLLSRYGIDTAQLSLRECAEKFQKSPIQIRKAEVNALRKLGALG